MGRKMLIHSAVVGSPEQYIVIVTNSKGNFSDGEDMSRKNPWVAEVLLSIRLT